jgi:poly(A) polymerase
MVLDGDQQVEVATFRTESGYCDGRHPDKVAFTVAEEDAKRRDFTVNGMFYDPCEREVIDYVGGQKDLADRVLRTIGNADARFGEDFLRMLRAVRFSTQLSFRIEQKTWQAVCDHAGRIRQISSERIAMELEAILTDPNRAEGGELLTRSNLAEAIFSGFAGEKAVCGINVLAQLPKRIGFPLALAALFAGYPTDAAIEHIAGLNLSKAHSRGVAFLLENRGRLLAETVSLAELKLLLGQSHFWDLYALQKSIQKVEGGSLKALSQIKHRATELKGTDLRPKPLLDGHELIALGVRPGPTVGLAAEEMYIAQLEDELKTPQQARKWVTNWMARHKGHND